MAAISLGINMFEIGQQVALEIMLNEVEHGTSCGGACHGYGFHCVFLTMDRDAL